MVVKKIRMLDQREKKEIVKVGLSHKLQLDVVLPRNRMTVHKRTTTREKRQWQERMEIFMTSSVTTAIDMDIFRTIVQR